MRILANILISLIAIAVILLIILNFSNPVNVVFSNSTTSHILGIQPVIKSINLGLYTLLIFALGKISVALFFMPFIKSMKEKSSAYQRQLEKTSISKTESSSKVEVLEAKIKVLEKVLEDALKNK